MFSRQGMTLIEIIVVLVIISIATVFAFPDFTRPTENAQAQAAQNNLLAIYTAQKNYNNNFNAYCLNAANTAQTACNALSANQACADSLKAINCNLSLNITDDSTYSYSCAANVSGFACSATRTNASGNLVLTITNAPVKLGAGNPSCTSATGNTNWCP